MNGMYITLIIFLNGLLSVFICKCDSDTVNIYLSKQNVTGSTDDLTGTCNVTGLSRKEVVLPDTCTSSPVLAWIGAYATYSPWIEYKGCGIFKSTAKLLHIDFTQKNVSVEPDIFKCFQHCQMRLVKHHFIGFQRYKCVCYFTVDIKEIVQCDNGSISVCGDNQNFICGDRDTATVLYEIHSQVINSLNKTGECGIVNIDHNQTTFRSMECSTEAAILCFDNGNSTLHAYPDRTDKWEKAVQFCLKHDWLISSVQNIMNGSLPKKTEGTYWVSAVRGIAFNSLNDDSVECKVVNIANNKTTFRNMPCSNNESILCFDNGTFTVYPTQKRNWSESVQFCQEQDELMSSVENVMNGTLLNVTDGTYWVFTTSRITVQDSNYDFCVASLVENGKKMTPIVKSCDDKLPVTCRIGSSDPWNGTSRECVTSGNYITSTNSYITTNMANVAVQSQLLAERNLIIIIVSGSIGFVVLVVVVIILMCKRKKRTMKTKNVKSNSQETKVKKELHAEALPDVEYKNNSDTINIYDHTDTYQTASKFDTNLPSEYDSMAGIKQEAEGLYDESGTCPSGNTQTKELEDGLYDHC